MDYSVIRPGQSKSNDVCLTIIANDIYLLYVVAHGVGELSEVDYLILEVGPNEQPVLRQMGLVNRVSLPPELVEHFRHMQSYCMMILFPLI